MKTEIRNKVSLSSEKLGSKNNYQMNNFRVLAEKLENIAKLAVKGELILE